MKPKLLIVTAFVATGLFAQGPNGFGGRAPYGGAPGNPATQTDPRTARPDWFGQRGQMRMRGQRMGMRGERIGMRGQREFELGRLLSDPAIRTQLGVSADQAAKIRQQETDFQKAEIRNRADLQIKRLELNELLSAEKPDRAAIDSKLQEIGAAQTAAEKSAIDYRLNMRDALTPAQRQKLQQLMAQRQAIVPYPPSAVRTPQAGGRRGAAPAPNTAPPARPNQ